MPTGPRISAAFRKHLAEVGMHEELFHNDLTSSCDCHLRLHGRRASHGVEVWARERCLGGEAPQRIVAQEVVDETHARGPEVGGSASDLLPWLAAPLREGRLEVRQLAEARPLDIRRRAQFLKDLEDRVDLAVSVEESRAGGHLSKNATCAPNIHRQGVFLNAEEDLGCSVPSSDHLVRVPGQRHTERPGHAEVRNLEQTITARPRIVHQHILGLEIAVHNPATVAELGAQHQLVHQRLDRRLIQLHAEALHVLLQVHRHILEDQVQAAWGAADVQKPDDVRVPRGLENSNLTNGGARHALVAMVRLDPLHSHNGTRAPVSCLVDCPIGALAQRLHFLQAVLVRETFFLQLVRAVLGGRGQSRGLRLQFPQQPLAVRGAAELAADACRAVGAPAVALEDPTHVQVAFGRPSQTVRKGAAPLGRRPC
mmetsp:Transcript_162819/g.521959  ORF Transcript_162819/g.521959 Transcript_162819/m.521959 type:complete len:426 (-) Transcript_162819:148-1425(-)